MMSSEWIDKQEALLVRAIELLGPDQKTVKIALRQWGVNSGGPTGIYGMGLDVYYELERLVADAEQREALQLPRPR